MTGATDLADAWKGRPVLSILMTCAGYYLGGIVGIKLIFPSSNIAVLWPSNAILLAALLLSPVRTWWIYLLAIFPTHLHLVDSFQPGVPVPTMLSQAFGNAVQAAAGAAAVRLVIGPTRRLVNLRSMTAFIVLAAIAAPGLAAAVVAYLFILTGWAADFWSTWRLRFLANPFAVLSITPLILQADADWFRAIREEPVRRYAEFGVLQIGLLLVSIAVFGRESSDPALLYAPLPLLLWAVVRFGLSGLCTSLLVVAFLSLSNAIAGRGPFVIQSPVENSRSLQIFLMTVSVPLMLMSVLLEERRRIADALRASFHEVRHLAGQLISAQEGERARIARDLHDGIGQQVTGLAIDLSSLKYQLRGDASVDLQDGLNALQQRTMALADEIRQLSHDLHPGVLQHAGLVAVLRDHCDEFGLQHSIDTTFVAGDYLARIDGDAALCLYRVAQEALRNVSRHAGARHVRVVLARAGDMVELTIADDGHGFDPARLHVEGAGLGLLSIDERVRLMKGTVTLESQRDRGTTLCVQVPLGAHEYPKRESLVADDSAMLS